jgi:hypothetical protein
MFLSDKKPAGHASNVHGVNVVNAGVVNRRESRFNKNLSQRFLPMFTALDHPNADYGNISVHNNLRMFSQVRNA